MYPVWGVSTYNEVYMYPVCVRVRTMEVVVLEYAIAPPGVAVTITTRHCPVSWTHLPGELLSAHIDDLEHLFSTVHQPHNTLALLTQDAQLVKVLHSSTGSLYT